MYNIRASYIDQLEIIAKFDDAKRFLEKLMCSQRKTKRYIRAVEEELKLLEEQKLNMYLV